MNNRDVINALMSTSGECDKWCLGRVDFGTLLIKCLDDKIQNIFLKSESGIDSVPVWKTVLWK